MVSRQVNEWTSEQVACEEKQSNKVSRQVTCNKEEICSHVTMSTSQATCLLVYSFTCPLIMLLCL